MKRATKKSHVHQQLIFKQLDKSLPDIDPSIKKGHGKRSSGKLDGKAKRVVKRRRESLNEEDMAQEEFKDDDDSDFADDHDDHEA